MKATRSPVAPRRVFLGTILLEPHRWQPHLAPHLPLAGWLPRIAEADFDGIELWERHYLEAPADDRNVIARNVPPVRIVSSYAIWDDTPAGRASRERTLQVVLATRPEAVKFNFGPASLPEDLQIAGVREWASTFPAGCRLLCECHSRTMAEAPRDAARLLGRLGDLDAGAILHLGSTRSIERQIDILGDRIRHIHVAPRDAAGSVIRLEDVPGLERLMSRLRGLGPDVTFTLEFTIGTNWPLATPEVLWTHAVQDLQTLRSFL